MWIKFHVVQRRGMFATILLQAPPEVTQTSTPCVCSIHPSGIEAIATPFSVKYSGNFRRKLCSGFLHEKENRHLKELDVDERIISKQISKEQDEN